MFKKIMIALMAVAVFAVPIGASASSNAPFVPASGYNDLIVYKNSLGNTEYFSYTVTGDTSVFYYDSSGNLLLNPKTTTSNSTIKYVIQKLNPDGTLSTRVTQSSTYFSGLNLGILPKSQILYTMKPVYSDSSLNDSFTVAPPKPVTIQAVKTVQEIVPQTATVAGGIVLAVSIILGVWLLVGLVKRLTYSFLR